MAESVAVKRLEHVTECAICTEDLKDARVLPCVHVYCLECIDKWIQKKMDDKVTCPVCRKEFEVPEGGTAALPKNCFVEKMLQVNKLSTTLSQGDVTCDVCCDGKEESGKKETKKATVYCTECRQSMCEQCCGYHETFRLPGLHKLIELNSNMSVNELVKKFPENVCEKHPDESLKIYCFDCKLAVCMMCYIKSHNSHRCSDIKEVAEDLGRKMSANVVNLEAKVTEFQSVLDEIGVNETAFCKNVAETEKLICERADTLMALIEDRKKSLLDQLSHVRAKQLKQTASVRDEIERHQIIVRNFIRYSNEVREKGTSCDIAKLAEELNARSEELRKINVDTDLSVDYNVTEMNFTSPASRIKEVDLESAFGKLAVDVQRYLFRVSAKDVSTMQNPNGAVTGIAVLNDELYVSSTHQIVVYCPATFDPQHDLNSECWNCGRHTASPCQCSSCDKYSSEDGMVLQQISNMVGCAFNNCLYASGRNNALICKVALGQFGHPISFFSTGSSPEGLSLTSSHNLLVSLPAANALYEYSTDGSLLRQLNFQPADISNPVHAVQLSDDHYAVTHHAPKHQFSVVSCNCQLVRSYPGEAGDMNEPRGIAVDERSRFFVADQNNHRVLVMDRDTLSAHPLRLPDDCKLNDPYCMHYDAANSRLYIGECTGQRVICCKIRMPSLMTPSTL